MKARRITISELEYNWLKSHQDDFEEISQLYREMMDMFLEGKSTEEVEKELGVSVETISKTYDERLQSYALAIHSTLKLK